MDKFYFWSRACRLRTAMKFGNLINARGLEGLLKEWGSMEMEARN
jgi:hypothetical protein